MTQGNTVRELLDAGGSGRPAIGAPGREPLDHGGLRALADATAARLNALGAGRGDRVALVLPNGPEMAAAFAAVACAATTAPLNPAYREDEFDFYLGDLGARLLVVADGSDSAAVAVAGRRGIPVVRLVPDAGGPAGSFSLEGPDGAPAAPGPASPDDTALVLHTSGTTSRPKIVPLTQRNVAASARSIGRSLALAPADRCLNVMPLFHIHGLVAAVLASLAAGGSVHCAPGFNALRFFGWIGEIRPSWYTAVPTIHQAVLARAPRNPDGVRRARECLRLVRSSSSSLPPRVMAELEETFEAPVIEAYGMTEAAHQMASNPLPPAARRPGSVGVAAGPEIAIAAEDGNRFRAAGETGEIVIRGPNVTPGYENNPAANAEAFFDGWFRTGDQGVVDENGYVTITGRLKEIINRGGEKISPREVDEILMDHPAVAQAVTFALPHDRLGEDIAAAVVLHDGRTAAEGELRDFAAARLADFKVPRKVVLRDEIPKGATGERQRIGLAGKLGLA